MSITRRGTLAGLGGLAVPAGLAGGLVAPGRRAAAADTVTVGSLQFGTVMWELDVIKAHGLDTAEGFTLEVRPFGGNDSADVALMGGAVDAIVEDFLWVARQRASGALVSFIPYSSNVGSIMVKAGSPVGALADLADKKLGVAGGPLDKGWIILQAHARKAGQDLSKDVEIAYGAPPLLNEKAVSGELDAILTYWNWCARLESQGFRKLVGVADAMAALGVPPTTPQLGYIFKESWGQAKPDLVQAFARASRAAKTVMATSDAEWERLRPLTKADSDATAKALRDRYREGIVQRWGQAERAAAAKLYALLAELGGERLVGKATTLPEGTFWAGVTY